MGQKNKLLEVFYEYPGKEFTVRKLSSLSKLSRSTVHKYLSELKKQGLVTHGNLSADSLSFRIRKINHFTEKLADSGLIETLAENYNPLCIILFGSIRKGDSTKESDIDLFLESQINKKPDISKFESKLGHKIELFIEPDINKLPIHLFNNIINGIKLYGAFKIR